MRMKGDNLASGEGGNWNQGFNGDNTVCDSQIDKTGDKIVSSQFALSDLPAKHNNEELILKVYKTRWYVLFMFSAFAGFQAFVWNFWGPIAATTEHAFGWHDSDIAFFANWGPITFIPMALPLAWLTDRKGLRLTVIFGMLLVVMGTGIQCISKEPPYVIWLTHVGQALNGMAGPIAMGVCTTVSVTWFPPDQRATATSIMYSSQILMMAISFIIGPFLVPETFKSLNDTDRNISIFQNTTAEIDNVIRIERGHVMLYSYIVFGICVVLLITMVIYFPNKPPHPPSPSASKERLDHLAGIKKLFRNPQFWLIGVIYGVSSGTRDSWNSMMDINFKAHGISQTKVGWIAFASALASVVSAIIIGRFADKFTRKLKIVLMFLYVTTSIVYTWLVLTLVDVLPFSTKYLFASNVLANLLNGAVAPLFYELSCEITYPVAEGITNIAITMQYNVAALVFLGIMSIQNLGTVWTNYALIAAYVTGAVALVFLEETHHRLDVDEYKIN